MKRRIKTIQLEIYEDAEASFFLALDRLKNNIAFDESAKLLSDSIHYSTGEKTFASLPIGEVRKILSTIRTSWYHLIQAGKYHSDYLVISKENFREFQKSEFGKGIKKVLIYLHKLRYISLHQDKLNSKLNISFLSLLLRGLRNIEFNDNWRKEESVLTIEESTGINRVPVKISTEFKSTPEGIFTLKDEEKEFPVELYAEICNEILQIRAFEERQEKDISRFFLSNGEFVLEITEQENAIVADCYFNGKITEGKLDLGERNFQWRVSTADIEAQKLSNDGNTCYQIKGEIVYPTFKLTSTLQSSSDVSIAGTSEIPPIGLDSTVENYFSIPNNINKDIYIKDKLFTYLYQEVENAFPGMSKHVKTIATGYLSLPLEILDTEEEHIDSNRKRQTYHEYVGKTVKNSLKRGVCFFTQRQFT